MQSNYHTIRNAIEKAVELGKQNFLIYPFGENGVLAKQILNDSFGIQENYIIDNKLSKCNPQIKSLAWCQTLNCSQYTVLFTCANLELYNDTRSALDQYFLEDNVIDIFEIQIKERNEQKENTGGGGIKMRRNVASIVMDHYVIIGWWNLWGHSAVLRQEQML